MSDYITTYTGKHFEPLKPDPEVIDIQDIAHALSMICRGNGHVHTFWSVGEHCICCAKEAKARGLSERMILACLLHDASECYMSDVPRPFKKSLPAYGEQEDKLLSLIYEKFLGTDLTEEEQKQLKEIDNAMLWYDLKGLLEEPQTGEKPNIHIELDYTVRPLKEVEEEYLSIYEKHICGVRDVPVIWRIKHIFDGDYGCEERLPGEGPKVSVTLVNESGEEKQVTVEDAWLIENGLDVGSKWPIMSKE